MLFKGMKFLTNVIIGGNIQLNVQFIYTKTSVSYKQGKIILMAPITPKYLTVTLTL